MSFWNEEQQEHKSFFKTKVLNNSELTAYAQNAGINLQTANYIIWS